MRIAEPAPGFSALSALCDAFCDPQQVRNLTAKRRQASGVGLRDSQGRIAMDQERWQQVQVLFHAVLERERGERQSFLDVVCGKDADLRIQIEQLLAKEEE